MISSKNFVGLFQHTAARRRLPKECQIELPNQYVSTHSRPKAAAFVFSSFVPVLVVSTHSRPKAAAVDAWATGACHLCFNTQPPEGGCTTISEGMKQAVVSTHSRPKAAARRYHQAIKRFGCFNTQPPEGGCPKKLVV